MNISYEDDASDAALAGGTMQESMEDDVDFVGGTEFGPGGTEPVLGGTEAGRGFEDEVDAP